MMRMDRSPLRRRALARIVIALQGVLLLSAGVAAADPPGEIRFVGENLFGPAPGTFHSWRVKEVAIDPADLEGSEVEVEIDLSSVDTGNEDRDAHLRTEDFFHVERHPTATVRVHAIRPAGTDDGGRAVYSATFEITMHGQTHEVDGRFTMEGDGPLRVEGGLTLDRVQWGIGTPKRWYNPMSIDHSVPVSFEVDL